MHQEQIYACKVKDVLHALSRFGVNLPRVVVFVQLSFTMREARILWRLTYLAIYKSARHLEFAALGLQSQTLIRLHLPSLSLFLDFI